MTKWRCRSAFDSWDFACPECKMDQGHKVIKLYPTNCPFCGEDVSYNFGACRSFKVVIARKVRKFCVLGMECEACGNAVWGRYHRVDVVCKKCKTPFSYATVPWKSCLRADCDPKEVKLEPGPKEEKQP